MAEIKSQSIRADHELRNFLVPSRAAAILYTLLGTIVLVLFSFGNLLNLLDANYLGPTYKLSLNLNILDNSFSKSLSTVFGGRLGQAIAWSLVGALTYICLWFLKNLINSFENDIIIDHYRHPTDFSRAGYWSSAMAAKIFFAALAIVLLAYTFLALKIIIPAAANLGSSAAYHIRLDTSPLYLLLSILIPTVTIYLWTLLGRLLVHLWRLL
jgi:hypothetical protein